MIYRLVDRLHDAIVEVWDGGATPEALRPHVVRLLEERARPADELAVVMSDLLDEAGCALWHLAENGVEVTTARQPVTKARKALDALGAEILLTQPPGAADAEATHAALVRMIRGRPPKEVADIILELLLSLCNALLLMEEHGIEPPDDADLMIN